MEPKKEAYVAGLARRIVLCAMLIFFTDNMLSAETVTLSTIMPASTAGVRKVWRGTFTNPVSGTNTYTFGTDKPKDAKSVIIVSGGGNYYTKDSYSVYVCHTWYWEATLQSYASNGTDITSLTVTPCPVGPGGFYGSGTNSDTYVYWTVIEYT